MKANNNKVLDLAESWVNGNRSHVKQAVKRINKVEFLLLCMEIKEYHEYQSLEQIAHHLTS